MAFDAVEEATAFSRNFVRREGWLGFILICGVALLAFYLWSDYQQTRIITKVLTDTQDLQRETLEDRRIKTEAIQMNTQVMQQLGKSQDRAADNVQGLVNVVRARIEHDRNIDSVRLDQAERFLIMLRDTQIATEDARNAIQELRTYMKDGYRTQQAEP